MRTREWRARVPSITIPVPVSVPVSFASRVSIPITVSITIIVSVLFLVEVVFDLHVNIHDKVRRCTMCTGVVTVKVENRKRYKLRSPKLETVGIMSLSSLIIILLIVCIDVPCLNAPQLLRRRPLKYSARFTTSTVDSGGPARRIT